MFKQWQKVHTLLSTEAVAEADKGVAALESSFVVEDI